jgi:hypothetical protein
MNTDSRSTFREKTSEIAWQKIIGMNGWRRPIFWENIKLKFK